MNNEEDSYGSRKFIVAILGLALCLLSGWKPDIDTTTVGIIVLAYNGANAAVKASSNLKQSRTRKR